MKKLIYFLSLSLIGTALLISSCGEDEIPETAIIKGTITLENNNMWSSWIDSGEVQLTIFPEFSLDPLAGWGEVPDDYFGPGVPGGVYALGAPYNSQNPVVFEYNSENNTYEYELEVDPGNYSALAIGFRHTYISDPSRKSATLGVYWNNPNQISHGVVIKVDVGGGNIIPVFNFPPPVTITVAAGDEKVIDFKADFAFVEEWF